MLDLSRLSAAQRLAVTSADGPLLIVAGPGSGKTTVLAARIAYLVAFRGIPPTSILALTFATKAARELRERLGGVLGEQGAAVDVVTFHAFGLRIIRQWCEEAGFRPGPLSVYGDGEALRLLQEAVLALGLDPEELPLPDLAARLERYRLGVGRDAPLHEPDEMGPLAAAYEALLGRRGVVDYPAMLALPLRLFAQRPETLRLCQDAYRYVLCDEFQDVCAAQYALLRHLAERHRNLAVVGDPCQTLYGWRGADVRFMRDFLRDFPEGRLVRLEQNFRSAGRIVGLANALGGGLPYHRPLWTANPPGQVAILYAAPDEEAEAAFVTAEIERLLAKGSIDHPGEAAVLFRTNQQAEALAAALRQRRLPYRTRGGDLFARREVQDAVAYLRLAYNPDDTPALARVANVPPRRLGWVAQTLKARPASARELPTLASSYGPAALASAEALSALVEELHGRCGELSPALLLDLALERSGYRLWLGGQADGQTRLGHLATLSALMQRWEGDLAGLLVDLQLGETAGADGGDGPRVLLTTVHGAKGGEWRVVFVVGVEEGLLPHGRSIATRLAKPAAIEEELRVAYVAATRPRDRLYLTCCRSRQMGERREPRLPSRFLYGLPVQRVERAA